MNEQIDNILNAVKSGYEKNGPTFSANNSATVHPLLSGVNLSGSAPVSATKDVTIDINSTHQRNSDGEYVAMYDTYNRLGDTAEEYAQAQSTGEKWKNGLLKFGGKTANAVVGSVVGGVYGIAKAMQTGAASSLYDNEVTNYFNDLDIQMNNKLPNYYTNAEKNGSFTDNLFTANFIANDVLGGASFTIGAIGSEFLIGKGLGLAPKLARLPQYLGRVNKAKSLASQPILNAAKSGVLYTDDGIRAMDASIKLGKAQELAKTARFIYTSSGYEAGIEALQFKKDQEESFVDDFMRLNGRLPNDEESRAFHQNLNQSANALWSFNVAVTGSSKMAQIGNLVGVKTPGLINKAWVSNKVFGTGVKATGEAVKPTKFQKGLRMLYANTKNEFTEGMEEGLQSVGRNTAEKWLTSTVDPKHMQTSYDIYDHFFSSIAEMATTEEGRKEFLTGAFVGGITGRATSLITGQSAMKDFERQDKNAEAFETYTKKQLLASMAFAGRVSEAQSTMDKAEAQGDFTTIEQARKQQTIANIEYNNKIGYSAEGKAQAIQSIEAIDTADLAKHYGVTEQEAETYKQEMVQEYEKTFDSYHRNFEFAEQFIGSNIHNASEVHSAVASTLTLGEGAYEFNQNLLESLKGNLSNLLIGADVLDIHNTLVTATTETQQQFFNERKSLLQLQAELKQKETAHKNALKQAASAEDGVTFAKEANRLVLEIQEVQERKAETQQRINQLYQLADMENPYKQGKPARVVTEQDLDKLDEVLKNLEDLPNRVSANNVQLGHTIDTMIKEYNRSNKVFKDYSNLSRQINNGEINFDQLSKKAFKNKTQEQAVLDFLETINVSDEGKYVEREIAPIVRAEVRKKKKDTAYTGDLGVDAIIEQNPYLQRKVNTSSEPITSKKPTQEELEEYSELKAKEDLNDVEKVRLNELDDQMSEWELYDSFLAEGVSIADLMEINDQLKRAPEELTPTVTVDTLGQMVEENSNPKEAGDRLEKVSQTYEGVQIRETKEGTFLHSVDKDTLLPHITSNAVVETNGDTTRLTFPDGSVAELTDVRPGVIKVKGWSVIEANTPVQRMKYNYSKGTYGFVYVNGEMMKGSLEGNPIYNFNAVYDLKPGDTLTFRVDVEDPYNKTLSKRDRKSNLKIYIVDSKGNVVGDVKSDKDIKGTEDNFIKLRELAEEVFDNGGGFIPAQVTVEHVHLGTPVFKLENGVPISQDFDINSVVDYGYYSPSGGFDLVGGTGEVRTTFVQKLKGKTPVVIFKRGNQLVAFPVNTVDSPANLGSQVTDSLNMDNIGKAIIKANKILLDNGMDAVLYFRGSADQNIFNEDGSFTEQVKEVVDNLNKVTKPLDLLSVPKASLKTSIETPINFGSQPLTSPKIVMNFKDAKFTPIATSNPVPAQQNVVQNKVKNVSKKQAPAPTPKPIVPPIAPASVNVASAGVVPAPSVAPTPVQANKEAKKFKPPVPSPAVVTVTSSNKNVTLGSPNVSEAIKDSTLRDIRTKEFKFKEGSTKEDFLKIVEEGDMVIGNSSTYTVLQGELKQTDKDGRERRAYPDNPKGWMVVKTIGKLSEIDTQSIQNKKC